MPEGFLSGHLVRGVEPGTDRAAGAPQGDFVLPDPPPPKLLFLDGRQRHHAGHGHAAHRSTGAASMPDVVLVHSAPDARRCSSATSCTRSPSRHPDFASSSASPTSDGLLDFARPRHRRARTGATAQTWACGPEELLDAAEQRWKRTGLDERCTSSASPPTLTGGGEGGHVTFAEVRQGRRHRRRHHAARSRRAGRHPDALRLPDGHLPHLHGPLVSGSVRDLRNGAKTSGTDEPGDVQSRPASRRGRRLRAGRLTPPSSKHPRTHQETSHGHFRCRGIRPPDRRRGRGARSRVRRDPRARSKTRSARTTPPTSAR